MMTTLSMLWGGVAFDTDVYPGSGGGWNVERPHGGTGLYILGGVLIALITDGFLSKLSASSPERKLVLKGLKEVRRNC